MIIGILINVYHNYSITLFMPFLNMTFEVVGQVLGLHSHGIHIHVAVLVVVVCQGLVLFPH